MGYSKLYSYNELYNNTEISCVAGGAINRMGVFVESPPALLLLRGMWTILAREVQLT